MCEEVSGKPRKVIIYRCRTRDGKFYEVNTHVMGKVTNLRNGEHKSGRGFTYPIGQTITDPNAQVGNHSYGLHLIGDPASNELDSYGSHRLAVLPAPEVWDPLVETDEQQKRCYHSSGVSTLFCVDCDHLKAEELNNPQFWQSLFVPRRRSCTRRRAAKSNDLVIRLPQSSVWTK